jgi:hypothetical protein
MLLITLRGYRKGMTEQTPEPTLNDIVALLEAIAAGQQAQSRSISALAGKVSMIESTTHATQGFVAESRGEARAGIEAVRSDLRQVRADVAGVKADTAFIEQHQADMHEALRRHIADPNAHGRAA